MPLVQAWQCPHTDKLFLDRVDYDAHLRRLARERAMRKKEQEARAGFDQFIADGLKSCSTFKDIERWIIENGEMIALRNAGYPRRKNAAAPKVTRFELNDMRWGDLISNSHSCPRDGVKNWVGQRSLPRGYPGWCGRIEMEIKNFDNFTTYFLNGLDIHSDCGGGGSYQVRMFASDWPALAFYHKLGMTG